MQLSKLLEQADLQLAERQKLEMDLLDATRTPGDPPLARALSQQFDHVQPANSGDVLYRISDTVDPKVAVLSAKVASAQASLDRVRTATQRLVEPYVKLRDARVALDKAKRAANVKAVREQLYVRQAELHAAHVGFRSVLHDGVYRAAARTAGNFLQQPSEQMEDKLRLGAQSAFAKKNPIDEGDEILRIFLTHDKNNDGLLEEKELGKILVALELISDTTDKNMTAQIFADFDTDQNKKVCPCYEGVPPVLR